MFEEAIAIARDWAIILLAIEALLLALIPLFVFWHTTRGLGKFLPKVRPGMRQAQQRVSSVTQAIEHGLDRVASPFITVRGTVEGARAGASRLWRTYRSRR
ncbi:MAG: hypothetical protein ACYC4R_11970 [Anaerolineae bacterium]